MKRLNNRGQLSLINIIFWVILVAVAAVLTPVVSTFMDSVANSTNNTTTIILAQAVVPFFWLAIVITLLLYLTPVRLQQY